jgi:hypothetical protein
MTPTWLEFLGVLGVVVAFGVMVLWGLNKTDGDLKPIFLFIIPGAFVAIVVVQVVENRSKDQLRAEQLLKENCKQIDYVQGETVTATGYGFTGSGSPIVGTMNQSSADRYTYLCDGGVRYTLTYDIEKYRAENGGK